MPPGSTRGVPRDVDSPGARPWTSVSEGSHVKTDQAVAAVIITTCTSHGAPQRLDMTAVLSVKLENKVSC